MIPVILGVCFIIFILFNVFSPDPALLLLGKHATASQIVELRRELGLDRPWILQYLDIVKSAFTFDFGRSWSTKQEIFYMIKQGAVPSLTISLPSFVIASTVALSISLLVAYFRGKFIDKAGVFLCVALMSISSLAYILFFQWLLAYKWGMFPIDV